MKITFITTQRHNVGDDFVREGLIHLLREIAGPPGMDVACIHKHAPVSTRHGFEWVRRRELSALLDVLPLGLTRDRLLECDLLVQSGAPVYWCIENGPKCSGNEWYQPLILKRYRRIRHRVPFLNLAAGSCQPYRSDGSEFSGHPGVLRYIRELHSHASVTTVRDRLAKKLLDSMGLKAPLIPCASIFARDSLGVAAEPGEYIALNFMPIGGHYDFDQGIRRRRWEGCFRSFYASVKATARCVFVCHDKKEVRAARRIDPNAEVFYSHDYRDYVRMYARASTGLFNRVHGAFMVASFGRPAFVVGSDSRAGMAREIGLRHIFVEEATPERLVSELERSLNDGGRYGERFAKIKREAHSAYRAALGPLAGHPAVLATPAGYGA